jgi:hypothetical protein
LAAGGGDTTTDNQSTATTKTVNLTVVLQGSGATAVKGIQGTITLPSTVVFPADPAGAILNGVLTPATGTLAGIIVGKYIAGANGAPATVSIGFITTGTMMAGALVTLTAELPPGVSVPAFVNSA